MSARIAVIFLGVALFLAGCRHPGYPGVSGSASAADLAGSEWMLTHLGGTRIVPVPGDRQPYLRFVSSDDRLEGYGSCNGFSAPYSVDGDRLRITGPAISTKRACIDPALNAQEQRFLSTLETLSRYRIDGDVLTLFSDAGVIARLERESS